jgi:hypothetical protein
MRWSSTALLGLVAVLEVACQGGSSPPRDLNVIVPGGGMTGDSGAPEAGFGLGPVDRAGRPLVALLLVPGLLQDDYNSASTFDVPLSRTLEDALSSRLAALDTIRLADGGADPPDWVSDGGPHPLLPLFALDVLLVDTGFTSTSADGGFARGYFDLEREAIFPDAGHRTCGGRSPNDNVVDTTLTLLVTKDRAPVSQGIAAPAKPPPTQFPYLADPF